jgi:hypothetical protein
LSALKTMAAVFQLRPLSDTLVPSAIESVVPEAMVCSKVGMAILQKIYTSTEKRWQSECFFFPFFFSLRIYRFLNRFKFI